MQYFMQQNSLDTFKNQVVSIEEYIRHIELINSIAKNSRDSDESYLEEFNKHLSKFRGSKKEFEYKAIIISLYGVLENTISRWIQEHIQNVSNIVSDYNKLEEKFQSEHFNRSIKLIDLINDNRHSKLESIPKEQILQKLNQILMDPNDFELNSEAYIPLSGNLKHSKVVESFKPLSIDLNAWESKLHREIIKIDDLVTRRNDIAHGVNIDDAILDITVLQEYLEDLQTYMTIIFDILSNKEIEYYTTHTNIVLIDKTTEVYQAGTVCIVNIGDNKLQVGDILFFKKSDKFIKSTILSIQKDDEEVMFAINGEFGLKLDTSIKKNSEIWK